jgi:hypothetical protein
MERYKRKFTESTNPPPEWDVLIHGLDNFKIRISYWGDSEFYDNLAILMIDGVGKEREPISSWIKVLEFIEDFLSKEYKDYKYYCVNHNTGVRIDIKKVSK